MLNRPGFKTSEFLIAVANGIGQVALQLSGTETTTTAAHYTVYGAIAFIISRGLAKYEPRLVPAVTTIARTITQPATPPPPAG